MRLEPPAWWYGAPGIRPFLLSPLSTLYAAGVRARWALAIPKRADLPVLCVGNLTAGGAGKTPVAIAAARALISMGERPAFLSRGYRGGQRGPLTVDPQLHDAATVGDEPLLLARVAPTVVAADKREGVRHAKDLGASVVVMDDGFQNPRVAKDVSIVVVDAEAGIGNGWVIPAGPLRAPLDFQLDRADAAIVVGRGDAGDTIARAVRARRRRALRGELAPTCDTDGLRGAPVVAFAGIGRPAKFFAMLEAFGATLVARFAFPDHHAFTEEDASRLIQAALDRDAMLVTTEKDWVRIGAATPALETLRKTASPLPVAFVPDDARSFNELVAAALNPTALTEYQPPRPDPPPRVSR